MVTVSIEHEVVGGEVVLEEFENVESVNNPPMTETAHLSFADDREDEKVRHGTIVRVH
jgi:hypothetical protein